jgi:hypothetical protein
MEKLRAFLTTALDGNEWSGSRFVHLFLWKLVPSGQHTSTLTGHRTLVVQDKPRQRNSCPRYRVCLPRLLLDSECFRLMSEISFRAKDDIIGDKQNQIDPGHRYNEQVTL